MKRSKVPIESLLRHRDFLSSLARSLLQDEALAEDVVQDTWVAALENPPRNAHSGPAWLRRVAQRFAFRTARASQRRRRREKATARPEKITGVADDFAAQTTLRHVTDAVLSLPTPYRQVILMRFYDGLDPSRIADRLGIPTPTVYSRLRRGLRRIRQELERRGLPNESWKAGLAAWMGVDPLPTETRGPSPATWDLGWTMASFSGVLALSIVGWVLLRSNPGDPAPNRRIAKSAFETEANLLDPSEPPPSSILEDPEDNPTPSSPDPNPLKNREQAPTQLVPEPTAVGNATVEVQVVWSDTGAPAVGRGYRALEITDEGTIREHRAITDARGRFSLTGLPASKLRFTDDIGPYDLVDGTFSLDVPAGATVRSQYTLPVGRSLEGIVVDRDERPVHGASVWVTEFGNDRRGRLVAQTDLEGRFTLRGMSDERALGAFAPGHAASRLQDIRGSEGETIPIRIVLPDRAGELRGRVIDERGIPVPNAQVELYGPSNIPAARPDGTILHDHPVLESATNPEGEFHFDSGVSGTSEIRVSKSGFAFTTAKVSLLPGGLELIELALTRGVSVSGTIYAPNGGPAVNARVTHKSPGAPGYRMALSRSDGSYELAGLPSRSTLRISHPQHGVAEHSLSIPPGESTTWNPTLSLKTQLLVTVRDHTGRPCSQWTLRLHGTRPLMTSDEFPWSGDGQTNVEGRFRFHGCPEDKPLLLSVHAGSVTDPVVRTETVGPMSAGAVKEISIVLESHEKPSASITGRFQDLAGRPVRARITARRHQSGSFRDQKADSDPEGSFVLQSIPPGRYFVSMAPHNSPSVGLGMVEVGENERHDLGLVTIAPPGRLRLTLNGESRLPPRDRLQVQGPHTMQWYEPRDTKEIRLPPGTYRISWLPAEGAIETHRFEILTGEETQLDLVSREGVRWRASIACTKSDPEPPHALFFDLWEGDEFLLHWWQPTDGDDPVLDFRLLPGRYRLTVSSPQGPTIEFPITLEPGSASSKTVLSYP